MKRIATICARKDSKGLPGKNKLLLNGLPLFGLAIKQAKMSSYFSEVVVSTNDPDILTDATKFGADLIIERPSVLSTDTAGKPATILHALLESERYFNTKYDTVVDLDVTSPLRISEDICGAINLLEEKKVCSVVTACDSHRNPYFNLLELNDSNYAKLIKENFFPVLSRQEAPMCFDMNAAVHVWNATDLKSNPVILYPNTLIYRMPAERSWDIDSFFDYEIVKFLYEKQFG